MGKRNYWNICKIITQIIFTITNVGDGSIDGRYWVITNNELYILRYSKDKDELYSVEAMEFMNDNIVYFDYPWEKR